MSDKAVFEILNDLEEGYPEVVERWIECRATK